MNSTAQTIYVKGALTPSQRDTILAATKWIERICDRKEMLPASFMDNTDPAPIAKKLRAILDSQNAASTGLVRGCSHDPRTLAGMPIGQYHCPECGEMVIAGLAHDPEPPTHMMQQSGTVCTTLCGVPNEIGVTHVTFTRRYVTCPECISSANDLAQTRRAGD